MCQPKSGDKFMIKCRTRNNDGSGPVNEWAKTYMAYNPNTGTMACVLPPEGATDNVGLVWELHQCSNPNNCDDEPHCLSGNFYYIKPSTTVKGQDKERVVECGLGGYCDLTKGYALVKRACDSQYYDYWGYNMNIPETRAKGDTETWFNFVQECDKDRESNCPPTAQKDNDGEDSAHLYINVRTEYDLNSGNGVYGEWIDNSRYSLPDQGLFALESIPSTKESYSKEEDAGVY
jgi:hypothetical protein